MKLFNVTMQTNEGNEYTKDVVAENENAACNEAERIESYLLPTEDQPAALYAREIPMSPFFES